MRCEAAIGSLRHDAEIVHVGMIVGSPGVHAATSERYEVLNPAAGDLVGTAPLGGVQDADNAARSAAAALDGWRRTPVRRRADLLSAGTKAVADSVDALAALLTREQGKPLAEAVEEITDFCDRMRAFVRLGGSTADGRLPLLPWMRSRDPAGPAIDGVTVGLVAWNFPVGLLAKKIGPVLLAGGTVVIKPALTTPLATVRVLEHMNEAGLPPGVLNCVTGPGPDVGARLISHPVVTRVHLTGSDSTGRDVQKRATEAELLLELSGSDPMIVCEDADLDAAARAAVIGRYRNAGQVCTAVKRVYVAAEVFEEFIAELVRLVRLREPGDGLLPAAHPRIRLGPLHTAANRVRLEEQLHDAVARGARTLAGGRRPGDPALAKGHFFDATVVADVPIDCRLATEEVFGPVLPVFQASTLDEAIDNANRSRWDLNASVWTKNRETARHARSRLRCRRLWINRLATSPRHLS